MSTYNIATTPTSTDEPVAGFAVVLDGCVQFDRRTLTAAEADAAWLCRHPARTDRVQFALGGQVTIVPAALAYGDWSA